jgi:hypothetical protein
MLKKIINLIFLIIFVFIFLNVILAIVWPYITDSRLKSQKFYDDEILKILGIEKNEESAFYKQMWIDRKFKYLQFTGQYEKETLNQKYLNITKDNGRKIINKKNCTKNFFFYGSSHTFGYNVKDNQTIPANFKKIIDKAYPNKIFCVYNFGSASHFSTQETIFFQTHILKQKIKKDDFIFFLDGISEKGNKSTRIDSTIKHLFKATTYNYWDKYKFTFPYFFNSLPLIQLYQRISQKIRIEESKKNNSGEEIKKKDEILYVFQKNVKFRKAICEELGLNCFTFLLHYPIISGVYDNRILKNKNLKKEKKYYLEHYELLRNTKGIIDIKNALDNETELSYIDEGHYSPNASFAIANKIYLNIAKNIK